MQFLITHMTHVLYHLDPAVLSEEECDKMQQIYENDCKPAGRYH